MTVSLFLADDHAIFRSGLRAFLEKEGGYEVTGEAGDMEGVLRELAASRAEILVLDLAMPGPRAPEVVREILRKKPDLGVVILTMHEEERYFREALRAGAKGFVLKKSTGTELVNALRAVREGRVYVDPALSEVLVDSYLDPGDKRREAKSPLTGREEEVLRLLAQGHTNEEVADRLSLSRRTVETHRFHIMEKMKWKSRAELVKYAIEKGHLEAK